MKNIIFLALLTLTSCYREMANSSFNGRMNLVNTRPVILYDNTGAAFELPQGELRIEIKKFSNSYIIMRLFSPEISRTIYLTNYSFNSWGDFSSPAQLNSQDYSLKANIKTTNGKKYLLISFYEAQDLVGTFNSNVLN